MRLYNESGAVPYRLRRPEQIIHFFDGLGPVEPGVVPMQQRHPDNNPFSPAKDLTAWAGAAKKA
jgi:S-adenosyl methyltransferase